MTQLNNLYTKYKKTTLHPMYGDWTIVDVNGDGDYVSVTDAFNDGHYNLFLTTGDHVMTDSMRYDLSVQGDIPLRIHGESKSTTKLIYTNGNIMYNIIPYFTEDFDNGYDYNTNPPSGAIKERFISCSLGDNKVYANNFDWILLSETRPCIQVGSYISLTYSQYFRIREISADGSYLVIDGHNDCEDIINYDYFFITKEFKLELSNIHLYADHPELIDTYDSGRRDFINHDNRSNDWNVSCPVAYKIDNVDVTGGYLPLTGGSINFCYDGMGSGSTIRNFNTLSEDLSPYISRGKFFDCYFEDIVCYGNSTFINCIFDENFFIDDGTNLSLIGCRGIKCKLYNYDNKVRFVGCLDVDGKIDSIIPRNGRLTETLIFSGRTIVSTKDRFYKAGQFISNTGAYEATHDLITAIDVYNSGTIQPYHDIKGFDFSGMKRYYGILTRDGLTDDTILTSDQGNILHNNNITQSDNIGMLYQGQYEGAVSETFLIESIDYYNIRLKDSWSILEPFIYDGVLKGSSLYFPYVYDGGSVNRFGNVYYVQVQPKPLHIPRIDYY